MCGFIGIYGPEGADVAPEIYEGLLAVQHRGQDAAGMTTFTDQFHVKKGYGLVLEVFNEQNMSRLQGNLGLGHVRYPTVGSSQDEDVQPFHLTFPVGVAMAHNGNVTNFQLLRDAHFARTGSRLNSSCDLEVIMLVFAKALSEQISSDFLPLLSGTQVTFQADYPTTPDTDDRYFFTPVNPNLRVTESDQVDTLNVFHGNSLSDDVGLLTADRLSGLGMGGETVIAGRTFAGGIELIDLDEINIELGKCNEGIVDPVAIGNNLEAPFIPGQCLSSANCRDICKLSNRNDKWNGRI